MDILITIAIVAAAVWVALFAYQKILATQVKQAVQSAKQSHPTIAIQQAIAAASSRGWTATVNGNTVQAKLTNARGSVRLTVTAAGAGSSINATIYDVGRGSLLGITTQQKAFTLLRKRTSILDAIN